jgi:hypothetical protein
MKHETLLQVAKSLRDVNRRLSAAGQHSLEDRALIEREAALIARLVSDLETREKAVAACSHTLADRLNNMLMGLQTVADQLRSMDDKSPTARFGSQLEQIIRSGRETLKALRQAVAELV